MDGEKMENWKQKRIVEKPNAGNCKKKRKHISKKAKKRGSRKVEKKKNGNVGNMEYLKGK